MAISTDSFDVLMHAHHGLHRMVQVLTRDALSEIIHAAKGAVYAVRSLFRRSTMVRDCLPDPGGGGMEEGQASWIRFNRRSLGLGRIFRSRPSEPVGWFMLVAVRSTHGVSPALDIGAPIEHGLLAPRLRFHRFLHSSSYHGSRWTKKVFLFTQLCVRMLPSPEEAI